MKYWSKNEIKYLKDNYKILSNKDLENNLDRTEKSIIHKANRLSLKKINFWTNEEIEYLKNNYSDTSPDLLILNLNQHTQNSIKVKANSIGLRRNRLSIDEDFLKEWNKEMAWTFWFLDR